MKNQSRTIVLIAPCCMDRTDCFARNSRGGCMALTFTDFKEEKCPFYKTAAQEIQDRAAAVERLERPDGDCSHEIKKHLLLGCKVMTNLDSVLKSRGITLPTKVCTVKTMVFPLLMCACAHVRAGP